MRTVQSAEDMLLEVVVTQRDAWIDAELIGLERKRRVEDALRLASSQGVTIDALSDASGLPPKQVRQILEREGQEGSLAALSGLC